MATAWGIDTYRDPEKLDITQLGKAMTYKNQLYDSNVAQVQQLVNQYVGTDLLKPVDQQYLGERLNTLVKYVNSSGTRDWSKKTIPSKIGAYVSQALDENVGRAIASTKAYRVQDAEISEIKSKKPELYSAQNEWFAKQDLERYIKSEKVGDSYNAQPYIPYTDVNKLLLENSSKLKDFGVEYVHDVVGGNSYFRQIGKFEKIDPEKAKQYLNVILDTKARQQLFIDGQYAYKDLKPNEVEKRYSDRQDSYIKIYDDKIKELNIQYANASGDKKVELSKNIETWSNAKSEMEKMKGVPKSKAEMADFMYNSDFNDKWTGFFSYTRMVDWKMDDSMFQLAKFKTEIEQDNRNYELNVAKETNDNNYKKAQLQQADRHHADNMKTKGYKQGANGFELDINNPIHGFNVTSEAKELGKEKHPKLFQQAVGRFNTSMSDARDIIKQELASLKGNPEYKEVLKNAGITNATYSENDDALVAGMLVNSPGKFKKLMNLFSDDAKNRINKTISAKKEINEYDTTLRDVNGKLREFGDALAESSKSSTKEHFNNATRGFTLDSNGNVVKGNVTDTNNQYKGVMRTIGALNYHLQDENTTSEDIAMYTRAAELALVEAGLKGDKLKNAVKQLVYNEDYEGFWGGARSLVGGFYKTILPTKMIGAAAIANQGLYNTIVNYDSKDRATYGEDISNFLNSGNGNTRTAFDNLAYHIEGFENVNEGTSKLGLSDLNSKKLVSFDGDPGKIGTVLKGQLNDITEKLRNNLTSSFNNVINIDTGAEAMQGVLSNLKAHLPVNAEIQKGSNARIVVDNRTGMANVTVSVKDGKSYEPVTIGVKLSEMPSQLMNVIDTREKQQLYSATNPYAVSYSNENAGLLKNQSEYNKSIEGLLPEKRLEAYANRPMTQEDVVKKLETAYGKETIEKNKEDIKKIIESPLSVKMVSEGGQWTAKVYNNDELISATPTGKSEYDPALMDKYTNEIALDAILQNIKNVILY